MDLGPTIAPGRNVFLTMSAIFETLFDNSPDFFEQAGHSKMRFPFFCANDVQNEKQLWRTV